MKSRENNKAGNVAAGVSAAAGATIGAVGGVVASQMLHANDNVPEVLPQEEQPVDDNMVPVQEEPAEEVIVAEEPGRSIASDTVQPVEPAVEEEYVEGPYYVEEPHIEEEPYEDEPQLQVLSYDTVPTDNGMADVAIVEFDGTIGMVADIDRNGEIDVIISDDNGNGMIDEGEILDVTGEQIAMEPFQQAAAMNVDMSISENDYVNDANVDDFVV